MLFDRELFEKDCQQAYYRCLSEMKSKIREGIIGQYYYVNIRDYLNIFWQFRTDWLSGYSNDRIEYEHILSGWNERIRAELQDYYSEFKRKKESEARDKIKREQERALKEERRRIEDECETKKAVEEERFRIEDEYETEQELEEERLRIKEQRRIQAERRKAREKKKAQEQKNNKKLSSIYEEWEKSHSTTTSSMSVSCPSCGVANARTAKFCIKCGTQIQVKCSHCGELVRIGSKFCSHCGAKLLDE